MIRSRLTAVLIFLTLPAAVFLQATLLANSLPGQITPNLGFLLTVAAGFYWGAAGGTCAGMWCGALLGAGIGSLAVPYSCLYGVIGWLAGLHGERRPARWTLPLATLCLAALLVSGESLWTMSLEGRQPSLSWELASVGWSGLAGLFFLALKPGGQSVDQSE